MGDEWDDLYDVELDPPAVEQLAELPQPVLLVVGGHDLDRSTSPRTDSRPGAPHVRRVDGPDTAHLPSMEEPEVFLRLLLDWVAEQD